MSIETPVNYIADLVATNPVATDQVDQGNDHLQLIIRAMQKSLPVSLAQARPSLTDSQFAPFPLRYNPKRISIDRTLYPGALFSSIPFSFSQATMPSTTVPLTFERKVDNLGISEAKYVSEFHLDPDRLYNIFFWGQYEADSDLSPLTVVALPSGISLGTTYQTRINAEGPRYFWSNSYDGHVDEASANLGSPFQLILNNTPTPVISNFQMYLAVELAHYATS